MGSGRDSERDWNISSDEFRKKMQSNCGGNSTTDQLSRLRAENTQLKEDLRRAIYQKCCSCSSFHSGCKRDEDCNCTYGKLIVKYSFKKGVEV